MSPLIVILSERLSVASAQAKPLQKVYVSRILHPFSPYSRFVVWACSVRLLPLPCRRISTAYSVLGARTVFAGAVKVVVPPVKLAGLCSVATRVCGIPAALTVWIVMSKACVVGAAISTVVTVVRSLPVVNRWAHAATVSAILVSPEMSFETRTLAVASEFASKLMVASTAIMRAATARSRERAR